AWPLRIRSPHERFVCEERRAAVLVHLHVTGFCVIRNRDARRQHRCANQKRFYSSSHHGSPFELSMCNATSTCEFYGRRRSLKTLVDEPRAAADNGGQLLKY